ncbi:MAG: L,D-transpeptidase family protein [Anaerolineaceae bacterium]|jgi:hypothetical protein
MKFGNKITRRDFLKLGGLAVGAALLPVSLQNKSVYKPVQQYPDGASLGRVCAGDIGAWMEIKTEPNMRAPVAKTVFRDDILVVKREVIANVLDLDRYNQRWVETPDGYIYSPLVQPVKNHINVPLTDLPVNPNGERGMWIEITVPILDIEVDRGPAASFWIKEVVRPRVYYSQIFWAYDIRQKDGKTQYLLMEKYGALPDSYWVDATGCRPLTEADTAPINPDVGEKRIVIDLRYQTLHCFEGSREVYFCEISSGGKVDGEWLTPIGEHIIWRKLVSLHMSAGGLWGFDAPGIGWTTLFDSHGAAIHSAYWHNNFGTPLSHGCVNCLPHDAKWIWRWTNPIVNYYPGELTVTDVSNSTHVIVNV